MVCPANAAFNRAAAFAALTQTLDTRPSRVAGSCFHQEAPLAYPWCQGNMQQTVRRCLHLNLKRLKSLGVDGAIH
jgi:hypothetical protein